MAGGTAASALIRGAKPPGAAIAEFNAALLDIERETEKQLNAELRRVGDEVRDIVRGRTGITPYKTGRLRESIRTSVRRKGLVSLYSNLPYAPLWNFGGTISPRGVPITFKATMFVTGTVLGRGDDIDEQLGDAFDSIAHKHGFL